jgi:hypothetical protein
MSQGRKCKRKCIAERVLARVPELRALVYANVFECLSVLYLAISAHEIV